MKVIDNESFDKENIFGLGEKIPVLQNTLQVIPM